MGDGAALVRVNDLGIAGRHRVCGAPAGAGPEVEPAGLPGPLSDAEFEEVFAERSLAPQPDELNAALQLTTVAMDLDPGVERIVTYFWTFGVPVNEVYFSYVEDDGRRYLARSWLGSEARTKPAARHARGTRGEARRLERLRLVRLSWSARRRSGVEDGRKHWP